MSKKQLIAEIKKMCKGKCHSCTGCIEEVKQAQPKTLKTKSWQMQCRYHTDLFE